MYMPIVFFTRIVLFSPLLHRILLLKVDREGSNNNSMRRKASFSAANSSAKFLLFGYFDSSTDHHLHLVIILWYVFICSNHPKIQWVLLVSRQGKIRLQQFYNGASTKVGCEAN